MNSHICGVSMGQVDFSRKVKAEALSFLIRIYSGQAPIITEHADYTQIDFSPEQAKLLRNQLTAWQDMAPGDIRINVKPVIVPYVLKRYGPFIAIGLMGAVLLGRFTK